jgi:hypothetical protein
MSTTPIARAVVAGSMILAPLLSLGSGFAAAAAVQGTGSDEITTIAAHPGQFYLYAILQLLGAYLFVPAFLGVAALLRERRPRWADLAGGAVVLGFLIAIGDAAVELMYWQMGGGDHTQMVALSDRYENAPGASLPYAIGGILLMVGGIALAIGLWRSRAVPVWAAVLIPVGLIANSFAYASGSQPALIASWAVLLIGLARCAAAYLSRTAAAPSTASTREPASATA